MLYCYFSWPRNYWPISIPSFKSEILEKTIKVYPILILKSLGEVSINLKYIIQFPQDIGYMALTPALVLYLPFVSNSSYTNG